MKLNDMQYKIVIQELQDNNWITFSPIKNGRPTAFPPNNHLIYRTKRNDLPKIFLKNNQMTIENFANLEATWSLLLQYIRDKSLPCMTDITKNKA